MESHFVIVILQRVALYGISGGCAMLIASCGFGSGTMANSSGTYSFSAGSNIEVIDEVDYYSGDTPWNAASTGNFGIVATTHAPSSLQRSFAYTQILSSKTGTTSYEDIGAAVHHG